ncbi:MAG: flagellar type III secretion system protein FliR [Halanaerobiaceae bacterium]|jgi:flagellar biosynthetic protein FliR|nr:flagellar type III secretion system protein FliR [Halanaerobiaceae bacterium]
MNLADILSNYTYLYLLVFIRFMGLFLLTPVFSSRVVPVRVRVGLAFLMALVSAPLISNTPVLPANELGIFIGVLRELLVGIIIGFITLLTFAVIQLAGRFVDMRMGFAIVNVADPIHGTTLPLMGQYKNILATLIFLSINGHHILIRAVHDSFLIVPPGSIVLTNRALSLIIRKSSDLFLLAFKVALPVIATLFIVDLILGFMARTMPQLHVFVVGLPIKITLGLVILFFSLGTMMRFSAQLFEESFRYIYNLLRNLL